MAIRNSFNASRSVWATVSREPRPQLGRTAVALTSFFRPDRLRSPVWLVGGVCRWPGQGPCARNVSETARRRSLVRRPMPRATGLVLIAIGAGAAFAAPPPPPTQIPECNRKVIEEALGAGRVP